MAARDIKMKTNATRILDDLGVPYTLREYEVDPYDLSAVTVALKIGLPAEQVFKTLVARGDRGGVYLCIIPGNQELDGKALARVTGDRRVDLVPLREVQQLCLLYTSDAADDLLCVDLGGRRI